MGSSPLAHIEAAVNSGKAVVSAGDEVIVSMVQEAIFSGKSVSFYLSRTQADAISEWYWTPSRVAETQLEPVSSEEILKIESELGIEGVEGFRSNRIQCACGGTYGAFEFLQQGVREHGGAVVKSIFSLKDTYFLRVNPALAAICPDCNEILSGPHYYGGTNYASCCRPT